MKIIKEPINTSGKTGKAFGHQALPVNMVVFILVISALLMILVLFRS